MYVEKLESMVSVEPWDCLWELKVRILPIKRVYNYLYKVVNKLLKKTVTVQLHLLLLVFGATVSLVLNQTFCSQFGRFLVFKAVQYRFHCALTRHPICELTSLLG